MHKKSGTLKEYLVDVTDPSSANLTEKAYEKLQSFDGDFHWDRDHLESLFRLLVFS